MVLMFLPLTLLFSQYVDPPTDVFDAVANLQTYMATLGGIVILSIFVVGLINGLFRVLNSNIRLLISWLVPITLTLVLGNLLGIGFLDGAPWWVAILYGLGAGLIANRGYDIKTVQQIILFIESLLGNKYINSK